MCDCMRLTYGIQRLLIPADEEVTALFRAICEDHKDHVRGPISRTSRHKLLKILRSLSRARRLAVAL